MDLWTAFTAFNEAHILYQIALNSTIDTELTHALQTAYKSSNTDTKRIQDFLLKEGVPLPLVNSPKPISKPNSIPEGAKLTDDEIANLVSVKVATSIAFCADAMSKTIRSDVGMLFFEIQVNLMKYAASLKNLMKKRGWLRMPLTYNPTGLPQ